MAANAFMRCLFSPGHLGRIGIATGTGLALAFKFIREDSVGMLNMAVVSAARKSQQIYEEYIGDREDLSLVKKVKDGLRFSKFVKSDDNSGNNHNIMSLGIEGVNSGIANPNGNWSGCIRSTDLDLLGKIKDGATSLFNKGKQSSRGGMGLNSLVSGMH